ncbi:pentatricopeptide repeat-containing protein At1g52640, mitochondrial [Cornus florida]|uniref:pentatricopeptide repeat-containing protein At1g52640, mitochondrial n=1 Tax=Cornus florida TaxID=4283 RepID=UPI0028971C50|nr:pentatricopeptide repeat-containing protein At1g52640, mitochondrial [Cornus florida]XP_059642751.1 pentatricopeptide repeat-containing protein At1g52640, mitochondrial [Cornus florida]
MVVVIRTLSRTKTTPLHFFQSLHPLLSLPNNADTRLLSPLLPLSSHLPPTHHRLSRHTFSSHALSSPPPPQPPPPDPNPPSSPQLVNDLCRVLSDFRNPQHDIESALTSFSSRISTDLVQQVLKRCKNLGFSAHRFFLWARRFPGFEHTRESYHILVDILGSSKQFPLIWDFLVEMRDTRCCEISPKIFWIVFRAYSRANFPADAIRAFDKMIDFGIEPGIDDLDQLLYVLCKRKHVKHAQQFFDRIKFEFAPSVKSYSILMRGWGDIGDSGQALKLFDEMLERGCSVDVLAYNSMLDCLCKGGNVDEAYTLFREMGFKGLEPDAYTYSIFIRAFCEANNIHSVFRVLDRMKRYNLVPNVFTYNCIIKKLCKNDRVEEAYQLLDEMIERGVRPDVWSYNAIQAFHCDHSEVNMALRLISRMDKDSCLPDLHTYNMVLKMLIKIGRFDRVIKVWESMEERGFYPSVSTYAVMVHGLCKKKGKLEDACKYFEMMIDDGIPPYSCTCELLRNRLIGFGFSEQTHILADKMGRSTSCSIQQLSDLMRGNSSNRTRTTEEQSSEESDE